jgi:hypothetical protein
MRRRFGAVFGLAVVPWVAAGPRVPQPPPIARPCQASALRILRPPPPHSILQGATGSLLGFVTFRNFGPTCSLLGRPRVRLVGNGAERVPQHNIRVGARKVYPGEMPAIVSVRALPHGAKAAALIQWFNWCSPGATVTSGVPLRRIVFTLPQGGAFSVKTRGAARCDLPGRPTDFDVGPFTAIQPNQATGARLPFRVHLYRATYAVRAGRTFDYRVRLTSIARHPFHFASCPVYSEELGVSHTELHYLNCRAVGTVQPGSSTVFDIHMRVPLGIRPGRTGLFFQLGIDTRQPAKGVDAHVVVTR